MEKNLKIKNIQKQVINPNSKGDWKFWLKIIIGVLQIISIVIFTSYLMWQVLTYNDHGNAVYISNKKRFSPNFMEEMNNWSIGMKVFYVIFRNAFVLTTIVNAFASIYFLVSAANHKYEGQGKFDNDQIGLIVVVSMTYIVFFYNASLLMTDAFQKMVWINYMSWICEHSLLGVAGIIYFIVFYNKTKFKYNKKYILSNWGYSLTMVMGYFILWTIIGMINKYTVGFPWFGNMSYHGEFPYDYLELDNPNIKYISFIGPQVQFFIIMFLYLSILTGFYFLYAHQINMYSKKHLDWRQKSNDKIESKLKNKKEEILEK